MKKVAKISKEVEVILKPYNEEIKRHITSLSEEFKGRVKVIGEQYGDIQKTLKSHTELIGQLAEDMTIIKVNVEFLKGSMKKKVDYDEFLALERRMSILESKIK